MRNVPRAALIIGFVGLVPMVAAALALAFGSPTVKINAYLHLLRYSALVLVFIGAVQWGFAMIASSRGDRDWLWYVAGTAPMVIAWIALTFIAPTLQLTLLAFAYFGVFMVDLRAVDAGLAPPWYGVLRKPLTIGALLALGLAIWVVSGGPVN